MTVEEEAKAAADKLRKENEDLKKENEDLKKGNQKLLSQVEGVEKLAKTWSNEVGEQRKQLEEIRKLVTETGSQNIPKEVLDRIATLEDTIRKGQESRREQPKDITELKNQMTEEQRAKADEAFKQLPVEERIQIDKDPELQREFLNAAVLSAPTVPTSLFSDSMKSPSPTNRFLKMFNLAEEESTFMPGGGRKAPSKFAGATRRKSGEEQTEVRRLNDGTLPRLAQ